MPHLGRLPDARESRHAEAASRRAWFLYSIVQQNAPAHARLAHPMKARQASPHGVQPDGHVGYAGEDVRCPLKIVVVAHAMPLRQAARCSCAVMHHARPATADKP